MSIVTSESTSDNQDADGLPMVADGAAPASAGSAAATATPRPGRSRWLRFGLPIAVIGAAAAAVLVLGQNDAGDEADSEPLAIRAVEAEQRDLIEYADLDGTLTYATVRSAAAGTAGTITAVADDGDLLLRGEAAFALDTEPVVVLYGDVPLYRPMAEGDTGDDVRLLEENLASLGYHATEDDDGNEVDTGFTVDGTFDSATTEAVERWQDDLGREQTGVVRPHEVIVVDGPATVATPSVEVGSMVQETSSILSLNVTGSERGFHSDHAGEIELVVGPGPVENGSVLYTVDDVPVTALVVEADPDVDFDRDLSEGVADGDDVQALEEMLVELGYDADGDLDIDQEFDDDTTEALSEWQEDLQDTWDDVTIDGVFDLDDYVVVETGTRVDAVTNRDSDTVARGSELFVTTSTASTRIVTTSIPVADQDTLVEGQEIEIEFPDGELVTGVVDQVATTSTVDPTDPDADPELAVEIIVASVPASAEGFSQLDVEIKLVDEVATGVTVVPVSALVAASDGYAVEVVVGGSTQFVAVEPGMFADGFVEVSGIDPGTAVVVAS